MASKSKSTHNSVNPGHCLCGCQSTVTRRFKPGHDATLKSALIRAYRAGEPVLFTAFTSTDPVEIATGLGWEHFLAPLQSRKLVSGDRPTKAPALRVPKAAKERQVKATVGRWVYEGVIRNGVFHYADRQGNPLETTSFRTA